MAKRMAIMAVAGILAVGLSATGALAFHCPKLIGAGNRLLAKAMGPEKGKAAAPFGEGGGGAEPPPPPP
ncbi:MAG TPA: hypothetical protein DDZ83_04065, partial [Nitrospinae bacterium]|nr:hypothetical protein [Nitrospinota bacterium]